MLKIYLIDDDKNILNILKLIIQERNLGEVCGCNQHAAEALDDLKYAPADIVIVDLLMPEMDGISFLNAAKHLFPETAFIMLSQVSDKTMIAEAYEKGVEFFIQKPVNSIEVEKVLHTVGQKLQMSRTLHKIQNVFSTEMSASLSTPSEQPSKNISHEHAYRAQKVLQKLGIIGDSGSSDILMLIDYMVTHSIRIDDITLHELCSKLSDSPKSVEQRIRRAASNGLVNLANLGLEDYGNDIFIEFSNTLYNFEQVRREMDFIRGKSTRHGNVKMKNFLNSLLSYSQSK